MKDWEIAGAYFLPRILCWGSRNNTLPGKLSKPNLRYLSLSENNQWTVWKSSDYFYPEMIPEPDYSSDSGDEAGSEDEDKHFPPDPRPAFERLRDLTEVYVSSVSSKKKSPRKKSPSKQAGSTPKRAPRQPTKTTAKESSQAKKSSKSPPRLPDRKPLKSPTETSKAAGPPSTAVKRSKSPDAVPKTKPPTKPARSKAVLSEAKSEAATEGQKPIPAKAKTTSAKSPPSTAKSAGRKALPKPAPRTKATTAAKAAPVASGEKIAQGDTKTRAIESGPSDRPLSSAGDKSSAEQSSDEDQLIKPRKPYIPSSEKQKLHKELKFSQKYGKRASSKTELQLALERYTENKVKRELNAEEKSSLEKILEYQARKIEMQEAMDKYPTWMECLQKPPSTWPNPKTEEFYRVHARVVSSNILTHCFMPDDALPSDCSSPSSSKTLPHSDSSSSDS